MESAIFNAGFLRKKRFRMGIRMEKRFCEKCGAPIDPSAAFCPNCGNQLKEISRNTGSSPMQDRPIIAEQPVITEKQTQKKNHASEISVILVGVLILVAAGFLFYIMVMPRIGLNLNFKKQIEETVSGDTVSEENANDQSKEQSEDQVESEATDEPSSMESSKQDVDYIYDEDTHCELTGKCVEDNELYLQFEEPLTFQLNDSGDSAEVISTDRIKLESKDNVLAGASYFDGKEISISGKAKKEDENLVITVEKLEATDGSTQNELEDGHHEYEFYLEDCSWSEAYQKCLDQGGYLVHINSYDEYEYIVSKIYEKKLEQDVFYIGGERDDDYFFHWVDLDGSLYKEKLNGSDSWSKDAWLTGEPSFTDQDNNDEKCMMMFHSSEEGRWVWNDVINDVNTYDVYSGKLAYIMEKE